MSTTASIDIEILNNSDYIVSAVYLMDEMLNKNWNVRYNGKINYLPLGDEDLFEWTENILTEDQLREIIKQKELQNEIVGIVFYWDDTNIAISMLKFQDNQISFNLNINRVVIDSMKSTNITDVNWYLTKIIPCLNTEKSKICSVKFNQDC